MELMELWNYGINKLIMTSNKKVSIKKGVIQYFRRLKNPTSLF
jgi:hypothetical protein